jgi:CBS-domain-containing membrane protein
MVKSYRGVERAKEKKSIVRAVTVEDYMTRRLITFRPDQTMDQVLDLLLAKNISGGPVIDENNNLIGIISEGDCLKEVVKGKYNNVPTLSGYVRDHMATDVKSVSPDLNIFELAQMFLNMRLRRFPVMKDGRLLGQISQKDVMRAMIKLHNDSY